MDAWRDFDETMSAYITNSDHIKTAREQLKSRKMLADRRFVLFCCLLLLALGGVIGCRFGLYRLELQREDALVQLAPVSQRLAVHIAGAVNAPGLYYFDYAARVDDAITAAGGLRDDADISGINLAAYLVDAEKLVIPAAGETAAQTASGAAGGDSDFAVKAVGASASGSELININTAGSEQLQTLSGIGPAKAQAIIDYREQHGGFDEIAQIKLVKGIGDAIYGNIKEKICVE